MPQDSQKQKITLPPDCQPLDPSGISDFIHEQKKKGYPVGLSAALLDYETSHRVC